MAERDLKFQHISLKSEPYSMTAEQAVLGAVISEPSLLPRAAVILKPSDFYVPLHQSIFTAIQTLDAMHGGKFDAVMLLDYLDVNGLSTEQEAKEYIFSLVSSVPVSENIEYYAHIVKDKAYIRALIDYSHVTLDEASDGTREVSQLFNSAEQRLYDIRKGQTVRGPEKLSEILPNVYYELSLLAGDDASEYKGLSTGFGDLDYYINGLNKSDLVLIGARPAMGKTSFALNLARNVAVYSKKRVVFFSLEMSKEQLAQRMLCTEARIETNKMRSGQLDKEEWNRLAAAVEFLSGCELYFDDSSDINVQEMKARIQRLGGVSCVFIDYLQLMHGIRKTDNRAQEVGEITRDLKLMAKDLKIPVVTCAQLSRNTEDRGKSHKPQLSDLRESGSIEQDADIVIMLYRKDYYKDMEDKKSSDDGSEQDNKPADINETQLLIQKNRHGKTGVVHLVFNNQFTLFTSSQKNVDE